MYHFLLGHGYHKLHSLGVTLMLLLLLSMQLTEFKDHKLIRVKKGNDGVEYLTIPLDNSTIIEFMEDYEA